MLSRLSYQTLAKIIIRGKGSVKEGKIGRKDGMPMPGEDEPLHAYITATDPAHVSHAVNKVSAFLYICVGAYDVGEYVGICVGICLCVFVCV